MSEKRPPPSSAGNEGGRSKRHKSKFYATKRTGGGGIPAGVEGFLLTCMGGKEFASAREVINVLQEFWEEATEGSATAPSLQNLKTGPAGGVDEKDEKDDKDEKDEKGEETEGEDGDGGDGEEEEGKEESEEGEEFEEEGGEADEERVGDGDGADGGVVSVTDPAAHQGGGGRGVDVAKMLENEIEGIRSKKKVRFSYIDTGLNGLAFVRLYRAKGEAGPGPAQLAEAVVRRTMETKRCKTRYTMKVLPAEATCHVSTQEITKAAGPSIEKNFTEEVAEKFAVVLEARAYNGLDKMAIIKAVAEAVPPAHTVDLTHPTKTILVQVVKTACCVAVVSSFKELAKYNLRQITHPDESQPKPKSVGVSEGGEGHDESGREGGTRGRGGGRRGRGRGGRRGGRGPR